MSLRTFFGPLLVGTQKNNNAVQITSNTPSATFLSASGTGNSYRNTGASDALQFVSVPQATFTGLGTLSATAVTVIPVNTIGGVNYPIVVPAGAYIDNIDFNITAAFTLGGTTPVFTMVVQLIGAPGSTYATAQTIATITLTGTGLPTIGSYPLAGTGATASASNPIITTASATPLAMLLNTGPTDAIFQLSITATGTTPTITAGAATFVFSYVVRNPDGTWYQQTPPGAPQSSYPATY